MFMRPMARMGRPSLLGTMARTAVVAGTATAVTGSMMRHQQARAQQQSEAQAYEQQQQWDAQQAATQQAVAQQMAMAQPAAPAAPAPAAAPQQDVVGQLTQLAALRDQGVLTEAEFQTQKARILGE